LSFFSFNTVQRIDSKNSVSRFKDSEFFSYILRVLRFSTTFSYIYRSLLFVVFIIRCKLFFLNFVGQRNFYVFLYLLSLTDDFCCDQIYRVQASAYISYYTHIYTHFYSRTRPYTGLANINLLSR